MTDSKQTIDGEEYEVPEVWSPTDNGGEFSGINRPTAGARHDAELPVGEHALQLYSMATPNGVKVTTMLEELVELGIAEAEYDAWPISIMKGDQFGSGFVAVNPNSKIPALLDRGTDPPTRVFESGAILLYLAEKFDGAFLPAAQRTETLNWLFWQMGAAPYVGGGFGHFFSYAPKKWRYPIDRFAMETKRQLDVLDRRLAESPYLGGPEYSIADIANWPWYGGLVMGQAYKGADRFLATHEYEHVVAWAKKIAARPAAVRGRKVNKTWGEESEQVPERHSPADFRA